MAYVTLEQAKDHCRIDGDLHDEDHYIIALIEVAERAVQDEIGSTLSSNCVGGVLAKPLYQAILYMVGNLYEIREPIMVGVSVVEVPFTYKYLLMPYKTWTVQ
jgi:hypothetical protein